MRSSGFGTTRGFLAFSCFNGTFCIRINQRYGANEPNGLPPERSGVWQTILTDLWREGVTKAHIAAQLAMPTDEMENLLFGLTGDVRPPDRSGGRPALRTV
jgi:hypothetical protein